MSVRLSVRLSVFPQDIAYQKPLHQESPNLTHKCSTINPGNASILGSIGQMSWLMRHKNGAGIVFYSCECLCLLFFVCGWETDFLKFATTSTGIFRYFVSFLSRDTRASTDGHTNGRHCRWLSALMSSVKKRLPTLAPKARSTLATMSKQRSNLSKGRNFNAKVVRHCCRFWQQSRTLLRHCCWCGPGLTMSAVRVSCQ